MMKKRKKIGRASISLYHALHAKLEKKEQQFCSSLQKHTLHWSRRKKIAMLSLVILLFGGFYATLLINVIRHENSHAAYLKQEHINQIDNVPFRQPLKPDRKDNVLKPP